MERCAIFIKNISFQTEENIGVKNLKKFSQTISSMLSNRKDITKSNKLCNHTKRLHKEKTQTLFNTF